MTGTGARGTDPASLPPVSRKGAATPLDFPFGAVQIPRQCGAVAQLVERIVRNDEARGSIPLGSTNHFYTIYFKGLSQPFPTGVSHLSVS